MLKTFISDARGKYYTAAALLRQLIAAGRRVDELKGQVAEMRQEQRLVLRALTLPPPRLWAGGPPLLAGIPSADAFPHSTLCRQSSFEEPYFGFWMGQLGQSKLYHRKLWELAFICQALWERDVIKPGRRGLGFGVGREPLSAFFASRDCSIVATDMAYDKATALGWIETDQHAAGREALRSPGICPNDLFDRNVRFQTCDMNNIPSDLREFDFCWSACALEHLGSIENGLSFIEASIRCLRPGGWAVHTTEFNLNSNDETVSEGGTVLFRRRDFEELLERLAAKGHLMAPLDFTPGGGALEQYIDLPPYRDAPHLRLIIAGYETTSFGLIIQKGTAPLTP